MQARWPVPSPEVKELLRRGAEVALDPRAEWIEELHDAVLGDERMRGVAEDPVLAEAMRSNNLANLLHWAAANIQHPGRRVPPAVGPAALDMTRDLVRRGLDSEALDGYRTGQSVAWRRWMQICFDLTTDPVLLKELLEISSLSISTFIGDTISAIAERVDSERFELTHGSHAERRATANLLLEAAPIARHRAERQLGYQLTGPHTAAIIWTSGGRGAETGLESAAEAFMQAGGATHRLTVVASVAALWVWIPADRSPDAAELAPALSAHPGVRVAIGRVGHDLDGFRRSHLDAAAVQRMLTRVGSREQVAHYQDVHLVVLLTGDPAQAEEFVNDTLGELRTAEPEILETLRTYVLEGFNTSRTAERLYTHRNTVIRRIARAEELLPRPFADNITPVAAALDLQRWLGS